MPSFLRASAAFSLCAAFLLFCSTSAYSQRTINVPADQPTVQGAINAASNGDTVLVAPGTYYENINFNGKAITVTSSAGAAQTIIDGGGNESVVTFSSGEGAGSVLNGFTFQHGIASFHNRYMGGGVYVSGGSPVISNNTIQANGSCGGGTGIATYFSSALIQGNYIDNNNSHPFCGGGDGGGILVVGTGSVQIIGNVITNNAAYSGGGIALESAANPIVRNNLITGNTARGLFSSGPVSPGGGIYSEGSYNDFISQNVVFDNNADRGGGIYASSWGIIENNTVIAGSTSGNVGSALYTPAGSGLQLYNNLLIGSAGQTAFYCDPASYGSQPPAVSNDDAYSSGGTGFGGTCAGAAGQSGNISVDPLFLNPATDFHLQPTSPAIDAGTNTAPNLPQTDFDGKPRIIDGNNDCVSTIDMGAYELQRAANVSLSTNSLSFGNQVVGTSSSALPVTLSNTGNTCFQFSSVGITGDFSEGNNCPAAGLMGGTSCNYSVTFTPTVTGPRAGALGVAGSDGITNANLNVSLTGYGLTAQPSITVSPGSLGFGLQMVGTTSPAQTITITSTGNTGLSISSISVSGPFLQSNNCPSSLAPTLSCSISISFQPTAGGAQAGTLSISDNASGSPQTAGLTGVGLDFSVAVSPASASVKHGQLAKVTVTINSAGGAFNAGVSLSCSGLPNGAACSFSPTSVTPGTNGANSTMTISTSGKTPRGNYNVVVTGTSGADAHSATLLLTVN